MNTAILRTCPKRTWIILDKNVKRIAWDIAARYSGEVVRSYWRNGDYSYDKEGNKTLTVIAAEIKRLEALGLYVDVVMKW